MPEASCQVLLYILIIATLHVICTLVMTRAWLLKYLLLMLKMKTKNIFFSPSDPEILNGIEWTDELDEVFKSNRETDPDIYWQAFGAQEGFMRFYPATKCVLKYLLIDKKCNKSPSISDGKLLASFQTCTTSDVVPGTFRAPFPQRM